MSSNSLKCLSLVIRIALLSLAITACNASFVGTFLSLARKKSKDLGAMIMSGWFGSQDPDVRLRMGARSNGVLAA